MSVPVEKLEGSLAKLTIEVSPEDFEAAIEKAYEKERGRITVPGFRKGKAPRKVIEQMYGKEVFFDSAINEAVPEAYDKAYDECGEDIVSAPKITIVQAEAGKPLIFEAEVALKPPVTLGTYKGIEVEKADVTVTEEEIEAELKKEQDKQGRQVEVTDRPVQDGDMITLDFEGFVDGVAFPGGKGGDYPLTIGSGQFIPGFEEKLIGAEIGQETDVEVSFPEDYHEESLAGKPAVFKCTVKSIKYKELPEIDDEFASEVSEFENLKDYKESIRSDIETRKIADAKSAKEDAVIDKIIENATLEIPDAMLETEQRSMLRDYEQRLRMQGMTIKQYFEWTGMTEEAFLEQVKPQALSRIQSRLVLEEIAKQEGLTVTEEDFDKECDSMAEAYQIEKEKVKEMLGEEGRKQMEQDILIKKALELAAEAAVEK